MKEKNIIYIKWKVDKNKRKITILIISILIIINHLVLLNKINHVLVNKTIQY